MLTSECIKVLTDEATKNEKSWSMCWRENNAIVVIEDKLGNFRIIKISDGKIIKDFKE